MQAKHSLNFKNYFRSSVVFIEWQISGTQGRLSAHLRFFILFEPFTVMLLYVDENFNYQFVVVVSSLIF